MRPGGVLTSVDIEPECQRLARKVFQQAGFAPNQARLILGWARDVLPRLTDGGYDMVFCNADPDGCSEYLEIGLRLLRPGGIIAFDGAQPTTEPATSVFSDEQLVPVMLPIAGGLLAAVKK
jgi:predicted O-methyltransferase YrrM